jgi:hypothetical protein
MTQQFKFGDIVRWGDDPRLFLYRCQDNVHHKAGWIHSDDGGEYLAAHSALQAVPHPDTVRLDWLVKNDCALTERLCDEDGDLLDTPFAVIQKQEEHFEVLTAACDIRQAIDAAMRMQTE